MQKRNILLLFIIISVHTSAFSQNDYVHANVADFQKQLHNEKQDTALSKKVNKNDFSFDVSVRLGFSQYGIASELGFSIDVKHILCVFQWYNPTFISSGQSIKENAILFGYRIRNTKQIISLAAGFGTATYKCTSGLNYNCYSYIEETIPVYPILMEVDYHVRKNYALGVALNMVLNKRESNVGILFVVKIGFPGGYVE